MVLAGGWVLGGVLYGCLAPFQGAATLAPGHPASRGGGSRRLPPPCNRPTRGAILGSGCYRSRPISEGLGACPPANTDLAGRRPAKGVPTAARGLPPHRGGATGGCRAKHPPLPTPVAVQRERGRGCSSRDDRASRQGATPALTGGGEPPNGAPLQWGEAGARPVTCLPPPSRPTEPTSWCWAWGDPGRHMATHAARIARAYFARRTRCCAGAFPRSSTRLGRQRPGPSHQGPPKAVVRSVRDRRRACAPRDTETPAATA